MSGGAGATWATWAGPAFGVGDSPLPQAQHKARNKTPIQRFGRRVMERGYIRRPDSKSTETPVPLVISGTNGLPVWDA